MTAQRMRELWGSRTETTSRKLMVMMGQRNVSCIKEPLIAIGPLKI